MIFLMDFLKEDSIFLLHFVKQFIDYMKKLLSVNYMYMYIENNVFFNDLTVILLYPC